MLSVSFNTALLFVLCLCKSSSLNRGISYLRIQQVLDLKLKNHLEDFMFILPLIDHVYFYFLGVSKQENA